MTPSPLAAWRKRLKLTQANAAIELGASLTAYRNWEAGKHPVPDYIALAASAVAMGLFPWGKQVEDRRDTETKPAKIKK
jgi:transcriptional regulator with XRE-family HTH domain